MTPRHEFTAPTKRQAHHRSNGICECHLIPHVFTSFCGRPLGPGNTFYEHIDPDAISKRNDIDNCAVLTKTCWKYKSDTYDKPVIAKSNRIRNREINAYTPPSRPLPGTKRSGIKLSFRGPIVRATGLPWRPRI